MPLSSRCKWISENLMLEGGGVGGRGQGGGCGGGAGVNPGLMGPLGRLYPFTICY